MIEVQNLVKHYGSTVAVDDVSFTVEKGEILGFLGPNAAGKTTTMRIVTGYMPSTSGTVKVAGYDVFEHPTEVKRRIGYMPENPPLYLDMTARQYLRFVARIKEVEKSQIDSVLDQVAEKVSITHVLDSHIAKLSKGYRQRVGLAQALIHNPPVLILDEPTVGLDPKQINEVRNLIKSLAGEHTIILSTHILPEVSKIAGRIVIINEGKVVAKDTPENLTAMLRGKESIVLHVEGPQDEIKSTLQRIDGVEMLQDQSEEKGVPGILRVETSGDSNIRKAIARAIVENNWGLLEMKAESLSLEEIFLKLTTEEVAES